MLRALGYEGLETYHMNEGHSSLLTLELMGQVARRAGRTEPSSEDVTQVKNRCVFTTHTPVSAGHDRFPKDSGGSRFFLPICSRPSTSSTPATRST